MTAPAVYGKIKVQRTHREFPMLGGPTAVFGSSSTVWHQLCFRIEQPRRIGTPFHGISVRFFNTETPRAFIIRFSSMQMMMQKFRRGKESGNGREAVRFSNRILHGTANRRRISVPCDFYFVSEAFSPCEIYEKICAIPLHSLDKNGFYMLK